ncbi:hypothetical protein ABH926_008922 [Catenulispora sp. GP43]|uniref:hypothetical protein n=1 Tax=Catenulispora sp. GP43 TaxID=3156263 RepID=UPI003514A32B
MDPYPTHPRGLPADAFDNPNLDVVTRFDEHGRPFLTTVPVPERAPVVVPRRPTAEPAGPAPVVVYTPGLPDYGPPAAPSTYNPVRDPIVMRLLAGAVAVGTGSIALSFALAALAAAEMALGLLLGVLLLIWLLTSGKGSGGKSINNITIHNTNKSRRWR